MTNKYERSLLNPLDGPSVGVPALVGVPSKKFRVKSFGKVVANTGAMNIQWMPHAALANDVDCVRVTGGTVPSDGKIRSNSVFTNSHFGDGLKARLVSARLRVYAQEAVTNGVLVAAACPYRTVLATSTVEEIVGRVPSDQMAVCDPAAEICNMNYIPKSSEERDAWLTDVTVGPIPGRAITDTEFPSSHVVVWDGVLDQRYMGTAQELDYNVIGEDTITYTPMVNLNRAVMPLLGVMHPVDHSLSTKTAYPLDYDGKIFGWTHHGNPTNCRVRQDAGGSVFYYGIFAKPLQDYGFSVPAVCGSNFTLAALQLDQESTVDFFGLRMFNPDAGTINDADYRAIQVADTEGDVSEFGQRYWWYTAAGNTFGAPRVCRVVFRCVPHFGETFDVQYDLRYDFALSDWRWILPSTDNIPMNAPLYTIAHKCTWVHRAATVSTNINNVSTTNMNTGESGGNWTALDPFTYLSCASQTLTYPIVQSHLADVPVIAARNAFVVEVTTNFEVVGSDVLEGATMTPPAGHSMKLPTRGPCFVESNQVKERVLDRVDRVVGRLRKAQRVEDELRDRIATEGMTPDLLEEAAQADAIQRNATKELADIGRARKGGTMKDFFRARKPR
jgi:hypothetical protein